MKLHIECQELICIPAGIGYQQHVIIGLTLQSAAAIGFAQEADNTVTLSVTDIDGDSESKRLHAIVGFKYRPGRASILTTREL